MFGIFDFIKASAYSLRGKCIYYNLKFILISNDTGSMYDTTIPNIWKFSKDECNAHIIIE